MKGMVMNDLEELRRVGKEDLEGLGEEWRMRWKEKGQW